MNKQKFDLAPFAKESEEQGAKCQITTMDERIDFQL